MADHPVPYDITSGIEMNKPPGVTVAAKNEYTFSHTDIW
jgi:hypothetical protein